MSFPCPQDLITLAPRPWAPTQTVHTWGFGRPRALTRELSYLIRPIFPCSRSKLLNVRQDNAMEENSGLRRREVSSQHTLNQESQAGGLYTVWCEPPIWKIGM